LLIDRVREFEGSWDGFNGSPPSKLKTSDGRLIDFGAAAKLGDERRWQVCVVVESCGSRLRRITIGHPFAI
jgi:hypothetical protein